MHLAILLAGVPPPDHINEVYSHKFSTNVHKRKEKYDIQDSEQ